jgi:hypothetical protein
MSSEHGTFTLTYTPPTADGSEDYPLINIEMSTSGDASVDQMLRFYEAFLAASGFMLKGDLQVVEPESEFTYDLWDPGSTGSDYIFGGLDCDHLDHVRPSYVSGIDPDNLVILGEK